ncbi:MAG: hypothetical protein ACFFD2_07075 [Promethearchaeota archaeon]
MNKTKFINCKLSNWPWAKEHFQKGKIVRIWDFNSYRDQNRKDRFPTEFIDQGLIYNFPATDSPFKDWYINAFNFCC